MLVIFGNQKNKEEIYHDTNKLTERKIKEKINILFQTRTNMKNTDQNCEPPTNIELSFECECIETKMCSKHTTNLGHNSINVENRKKEQTNESKTWKWK